MFFTIHTYVFWIIIWIDCCKSWSLWSYKNETERGPLYSSRQDEEDNQDKYHVGAIDVEKSMNESLISPSTNDDKHVMSQTAETWVDFAISASNLAFPYMPESVQSINIDWSQAIRILKAVESSAGISYDSFSKIAGEIFPVAAPLLFDIARILISMSLKFMEDSESHLFIQRSGVEHEEVVENVMKALESFTYYMTGYDIMTYHVSRGPLR